MSNKRLLLESKLAKIEEKVILLESKKEAKSNLEEILKSGYTTSDLQRLKDELESNKSGNVYSEIIDELDNYPDTVEFYRSKSAGNLESSKMLKADILSVLKSLNV